MKNWQLRWFVLRTEALYFYKDQDETKAQVTLTQVHIQHTLISHNGKGCVGRWFVLIGIHINARTYIGQHVPPGPLHPTFEPFLPVKFESNTYSYMFLLDNTAVLCCPDALINNKVSSCSVVLL